MNWGLISWCVIILFLDLYFILIFFKFIKFWDIVGNIVLFGMVYVCDMFWDVLLLINIFVFNLLILICCLEGNVDVIWFFIEDKFFIRIGDLSCFVMISVKSNEIILVEDICNFLSFYCLISLIFLFFFWFELIGIFIFFSLIKFFCSVWRLVLIWLYKFMVV